MIERGDNKFSIGSELMEKLETLNVPIYPVMVPIDELAKSKDIIVYKRTGYSLERSKMGVFEQKVVVEITAVCTSYKDSINLINNIYNLLNSNTCVLTNSAEDFVEDRFIQVAEFEIISIKN